MLMQNHGWQWKCNQVKKLIYDFSNSLNLYAPCFVIVLPAKFMPLYALWVSYGNSGNLHFSVPDFCVFKGRSFQKASTKLAPNWPMCNSMCLWSGSEEFPWLGLPGSITYRNRGRWSGSGWGLCSLRWMINLGDKCKVIETEKNSDYMLLFDSYHSLSTYYMPRIVVFHLRFSC